MIKFTELSVRTICVTGANLPSTKEAHRTSKGRKSTVHIIGLPVMTVEQVMRMDMDVGVIPVVMNMLVDEIDSQ